MKRTTLLAMIAGLCFVFEGLARDDLFTWTRVLRLVVGAAIAGLGVLARDVNDAGPTRTTLPPPEGPPPT